MFEVAVVTAKKGEGGLKLLVFLEKQVKKTLQKFTFEVVDKGKQKGAGFVMSHIPNAPRHASVFKANTQ